MKRGIIFIVVLAFVVFSALSAGAQSLLDNPDYKKAQELQRQSERAYAEGDYDKAFEYAEEAKLYIQRSNEYVTRRVLTYRANSWLKRAMSRVNYFKSVGVDPQYAGVFARAQADLALAQESFDAGAYEESMTYSQKVLSDLEGVSAAARK
ncbi:MAG: hypothetical protein JW820_17050 [Spirochaetales bacterium]|nr:hypothetical protein [Spirochaetales bacterium]